MKVWPGKPFPPGGDQPSRDETPHHYRIGVWVAVASILMLFMALTSAYVFRAAVRFDDAVRWFENKGKRLSGDAKDWWLLARMKCLAPVRPPAMFPEVVTLS